MKYCAGCVNWDTELCYYCRRRTGSIDYWEPKTKEKTLMKSCKGCKEYELYRGFYPCKDCVRRLNCRQDLYVSNGVEKTLKGELKELLERY